MDAKTIMISRTCFCPDVQTPVNLCGTQATCAAAHGCVRTPTECPLYLHFLVKTTAWHWGLSE